MIYYDFFFAFHIPHFAKDSYGIVVVANVIRIRDNVYANIIYLVMYVHILIVLALYSFGKGHLSVWLPEIQSDWLKVTISFEFSIYDDFLIILVATFITPILTDKLYKKR